MIRRPDNLLYASAAAPQPGKVRAKAGTKTVGSRAPGACYRIGVIDVSAKAGLLFSVLNRVNRKQSRFSFFPVETHLPMGVGLMGDRVREIMSDKNIHLSSDEWDEISTNTFAPDYMPFLESTRDTVGVDVLVALVAPLLAWIDDPPRAHWGYFSLSEGQNALVSAAEVRDYAKMADRPFEAAMAILTFAQVLASLFNVQFHRETRGCIFDFCQDRIQLVGAFERVQICEQSLAELPADEHDSVLATIDAIRSYTR